MCDRVAIHDAVKRDSEVPEVQATIASKYPALHNLAQTAGGCVFDGRYEIGLVVRRFQGDFFHAAAKESTEEIPSEAKVLTPISTERAAPPSNRYVQVMPRQLSETISYGFVQQCGIVKKTGHVNSEEWDRGQLVISLPEDPS